jgi:hypothetical protein
MNNVAIMIKKLSLPAAAGCVSVRYSNILDSLRKESKVESPSGRCHVRAVDARMRSSSTVTVRIIKSLKQHPKPYLRYIPLVYITVFSK